MIEYTINIDNVELKKSVSITVKAKSIGEALDNAAELVDTISEIIYAETDFICKKLHI